MMSGGLAFSEAKDMDKLRKKSLKGWNLKRFRFAGYEIEKGEPEDVIYSIDYRTLEPNADEEYYELFQSAGWTHVCSEYNMHIFKAAPGTKPIYSDRESKVDKINRLAQPVQPLFITFLGITIVLWLLMTFTEGAIQRISEGAFIGSLVLTIPAVMTYLATRYHKWKNKNTV